MARLACILVASMDTAGPTSTTTTEVAIPRLIPPSEAMDTTSNRAVFGPTAAPLATLVLGPADAVASPSRPLVDTPMDAVLVSCTLPTALAELRQEREAGVWDSVVVQ